MKRTVFTAILFAISFIGSTSFAKDEGCKFSDPKRLEEHLAKHIKYPTTGKDLKAACKKEWPDEFTKEENACAESKLKDTAKYTNASEVKKALGL